MDSSDLTYAIPLLFHIVLATVEAFIFSGDERF